MSYCDQYETVKEGLPRLSHMGNCDTCRAEGWRNHRAPRLYLTTVPGAHNDSRAYRFHKDFDKGMDEYRKARDEGLTPDSTTLDAVNKAKAEALSEKKALKKLSKVADVDNLKTKHKVG